MARVITYFSFDLMTSTLLAELPFSGVKWSKRLNAAGSFSGKLDLADPRMATIGAVGATRSSRTLLVVDVDGAIEWAGIIWTRPYQSSDRTLSVTASEVWSYFGRRAQPFDYTNPPTSGPGHAWWSANPAPAEDIAAAIIADTIATPGSALSTMAIDVIETQSNANPIVQSLPISQRQTVDQIVTMMAQGGYLTGFDFSIEWAWSSLSGSIPTPALMVSYPRAGRIAGSTGLVVDAGQGTGYTWPEDGSQQANTVYGLASGSGSLEVIAGPDPNVLDAGYPLLEDVVSYNVINDQSPLTAAALGDQARSEWPIITPTITVPMFGSALALGDFVIGDDVRVIIPPDERFVAGLDTYLRIVATDLTPGDEGEPLMTLTFSTPPGLAPVPPPPGI